MSGLSEIISEEHIDYWKWLEPKIYYKDKEPYGVIGLHENSSWTFICAATKDPASQFTTRMLIDVIDLIKSRNVCIITDVKEYQPKMRQSLSRFGNFSFEYDEDGIMFSYRRL